MDTNAHIQPYTYQLLSDKQRVKITNRLTNLSITKYKSQIVWELSGQGRPYRNLSTHERIMLENALKQFGDEK